MKESEGRLAQTGKWVAFRALEGLSHLRHRPAPLCLTPAEHKPVRGGSVWVFVSTIGELNAIDHWLRALLSRLGQPDLVLLTDRSTYKEAYLRKYPGATVAEITGTTAQARHLARACPPRLLVIAEIPCLLHDAPCRFSYATVKAARQAGACVVLINGWLYGDQAPSRLDKIENQLFRRDYLQSIDLALVQTDEVRRTMLAEGASARRVCVTGNLKYDAMRELSRRAPTSPLALSMLAHRSGPIVVAGSVTETADQKGLIDAFVDLHRYNAGARMVLAPRHPENRERMAALARLLAETGLGHHYRSQIDASHAMSSPILVLDTMGELGECYAASTFSYVGTDHNVLEPLAYSRLVFVSGEWHAGYPSFPVYRQALSLGLVTQVEEPCRLGPTWVAALRSLDDLLEAQRSRVGALIDSDEGRIAVSLGLVFERLGEAIRTD